MGIVPDHRIVAVPLIEVAVVALSLAVLPCLIFCRLIARIVTRFRRSI